MDKKKIEKIALEQILDLINRTSNSNNLRKKYEENKNKIHFLPVEYRNLTSFLASLNIRFGDFIQKFIIDLLRSDNKFNLSDLSGKSIKGIVTSEEDSKISKYIENSQNNNNFKKYDLSFLDTEYKFYENKSKNKDIDLLLYDNNHNYYLIELKFSDNHDTGKFVEIYRKLFYTLFSLRRYFEMNNIKYNKINPVLVYFDSTKRYEGIFLKEEENLFRGENFWNKFSEISFDDVKTVLDNISKNETVKNELRKICNNFINK